MKGTGFGTPFLGRSGICLATRGASAEHERQQDRWLAVAVEATSGNCEMDLHAAGRADVGGCASNGSFRDIQQGTFNEHEVEIQQQQQQPKCERSILPLTAPERRRYFPTANVRQVDSASERPGCHRLGTETGVSRGTRVHDGQTPAAPTPTPMPTARQLGPFDLWSGATPAAHRVVPFPAPSNSLRATLLPTKTSNTVTSRRRHHRHRSFILQGSGGRRKSDLLDTHRSSIYQLYRLKRIPTIGSSYSTTQAAIVAGRHTASYATGPIPTHASYQRAGHPVSAPLAFVTSYTPHNTNLLDNTGRRPLLLLNHSDIRPASNTPRTQTSVTPVLSKTLRKRRSQLSASRFNLFSPSAVHPLAVMYNRDPQTVHQHLQSVHHLPGQRLASTCHPHHHDIMPSYKPFGNSTSTSIRVAAELAEKLASSLTLQVPSQNVTIVPASPSASDSGYSERSFFSERSTSSSSTSLSSHEVAQHCHTASINVDLEHEMVPLEHAVARDICMSPTLREGNSDERVKTEQEEEDDEEKTARRSRFFSVVHRLPGNHFPQYGIASPRKQQPAMQDVEMASPRLPSYGPLRHYGNNITRSGRDLQVCGPYGHPVERHLRVPSTLPPMSPAPTLSRRFTLPQLQIPIPSHGNHRDLPSTREDVKRVGFKEIEAEEQEFKPEVDLDFAMDDDDLDFKCRGRGAGSPTATVRRPTFALTSKTSELSLRRGRAIRGLQLRR